MPLLETQSKIGFSRETFKIPTDVRVELTKYSRFSESDADHVVVEALRYVFLKDKEFSDWKAKNPAEINSEEVAQKKAGRPKVSAAQVG